MELNKDEIQQALDEEIKNAEKRYGKAIKFTLINIIGLVKMLNPNEGKKETKLIPFSKWNDYHDFPKVGSLYQYKFNNTDNFNYCVVKFGKRVLIDEEKFFTWMHNRCADS